MIKVVYKTEIKNLNTGKTELDQTIDYDKNGNIIRIKDNDLTILNKYDNHNNLIETVRSDGYWARFRYDNDNYLTHYMNSKGYEEWYDHGEIIKTRLKQWKLNGGNKNEIKKEN